MPFHIIHEANQIVIQTSDLELAFGRESGGLTRLRRPGGPSVLGHGPAAPGLDVRLGGRWLGQGGFVRYLNYRVSEHDGGVELVISIGLGPLRVYDRLWITGTLLVRTVTVENVGPDEQQLTAVRLSLPHAGIGRPEDALFAAPSNLNRPQVLLPVAARQRMTTAIADPEFMPQLRRGRLFEEAPDRGPGLLAIHSAHGDESLLCWFFSRVESSRPLVDGSGTAATLSHEIELAGWLRPGGQIAGGTQYILLTAGQWPEPISAVQRTQSALNQLTPLANRPAWILG